ncbi:hypothetical protein [Aeoliella mucimassa]|uniref:STAS domain-containing protein n=1 Tax=Aeoliella mucimassa TaxID=2527972 RepID=A0A518AKD7_9BACT|nr:hypothetical protein [Aeoliella mucimassa]QDU55185.1 hypothetical protein Pan181_13710 [Aeoliella mucimassa]
MIQFKSGFTLDVNRGPNWLFLRLEPSDRKGAKNLAADLWSVVSKHFTYRVVLEFSNEFDELTPELIEQLDKFREDLEAHDGALRVCGLNKKCAERLSKQCTESRIKSHLCTHSTVANAVFGDEHAPGDLPPKPHLDPESVEVKQDNAYEALRVH